MGLIDAFKRPFEWLIKGFSLSLELMLEKLMTLTHRTGKWKNAILRGIAFEFTAGTLHPKHFRTEAMREHVKKVKEVIKHSPTTNMEFINEMFSPFYGASAPELFLERIGIDASQFPPTLKGVMDLLNFNADVVLLSAYIDILGDITHHAHLKHIGKMIDRIMSASGMPELAGTAFGWAFGQTLAPQMSYAVNEQNPVMLPSGGDLIRFLVKDVYLGVRGEFLETEEQLAEITAQVEHAKDPMDWVDQETWRGKMLVPYPPQMYFDNMKKQGFTTKWAEDYWASHWREISFTEGREMLARLSPETLEQTWQDYLEILPAGVSPSKENVLKYVAFTPEDLTGVLRLADINPVWQSRLSGIVYSPYTRVDLRRMYEDGVFLEQVGDIETAISEMEVADPQFRAVFTGMRELGYGKEKAYRLSVWYTRYANREIIDSLSDIIIMEYRKQRMTEEDTLAVLTRLLPRPEIAEMLVQDATYAGPPRLPTKAELHKWFLTGERTSQETAQILSWMGYGERDIATYLKLWGVEKEAS